MRHEKPIDFSVTPPYGVYGVCLAILRQHHLRYAREYVHPHVFAGVPVRHVVMLLLVWFDLIVVVEKDYVPSSKFRVSDECNGTEIDLRGPLYLYLFRGLSQYGVDKSK